MNTRSLLAETTNQQTAKLVSAAARSNRTKPIQEQAKAAAAATGNYLDECSKVQGLLRVTNKIK